MNRPFSSLTSSKHNPLFAISFILIVFCTALTAQDKISVTECPGQPRLAVSFQIDCSHLNSADDRKLCRPFIENQACRAFPVYRKITGINLENTCKSIQFTIYEDENWPHPKGEGGLALHCAVDYLARYSVKSATNAKLGPYDVHEILHEYQLGLGPLPDAHVLFSSSMAEAARGVGDTADFERRMKNMKDEAQRLRQELEAGKYKSSPNECRIAQTQVEESLYLENPRTVYAFYRKLGPDKARDQASREARFSRMLWVVSGPKPEVKQFLVDHGCSNF